MLIDISKIAEDGVSLPRGVLKDQVFLHVARLIGQLGTCDRARVGAVITRDGRAISWGFNGAAPGQPHCDKNDHGWAGHPDVEKVSPFQREGAIYYKLDESGCRNVTHAEANALAYAARQGISTDGGTLYVERTPCIDCARLVIAAGITRVVAAQSYRDTAGLVLLQDADVTAEIAGSVHG